MDEDVKSADIPSLSMNKKNSCLDQTGDRFPSGWGCMPNSNLINNLVFGFDIFNVLIINDRFRLRLSIVSC